MANSRLQPPISRRIHCINCNMCVNPCNASRRHRVLDLETKIISVIGKWISPEIITDEDYICETCLKRSATEDDKHDQGVSPSNEVRRICIVCGRSLASRQSHIIMNENTRFISIMVNRISPRQIFQCDRSCHACWMSVKREVTRCQQLDVNTDSLLPLNIESQQREQLSGEEDSPVNEPANPQPESTPSASPSVKRSIPSSVILPNFRRGPNTSSHCIFYGCENIAHLRTIPKSLKTTLFHSYRYYVPPFARACPEHLQYNNWDSLYDAPNSMDSFTADQIEQIFFSFTACKGDPLS